MNIAQHQQQDLKLPKMDDAELKRYWQYQNGREFHAKKTGWLIDMLPIAQDLRALAEAEMESRGIDYSCFKKLL